MWFTGKTFINVQPILTFVHYNLSPGTEKSPETAKFAIRLQTPRLQLSWQIYTQSYLRKCYGGYKLKY